VVGWLCGCVVGWLGGCVVVWLCGRVVVWLGGRVVVWLFGHRRCTEKCCVRLQGTSTFFLISCSQPATGTHFGCGQRNDEHSCL